MPQGAFPLGATRDQPCRLGHGRRAAQKLRSFGFQAVWAAYAAVMTKLWWTPQWAEAHCGSFQS